MDLNTPQNLDPKLKEAYERIMGQGSINQESPLRNTQQGPELQPISNDLGNQESLHNANMKTEETHHNSHRLLFTITGIGAIVFLIGYAIIWAKIFNLI